MPNIPPKLVILAMLAMTSRALGEGPSTLTRDGDFEKTNAATNSFGGWYFVRQASSEVDARAPRGKRVIRFRNETPGRDAQAQQLIRVDGRVVRGLNVSVWVLGDNIGPGQSSDQTARIKLVFFDEQHQPLGEQWLGPWLGTFPWKHEQGRLDVPPKARMALVFVGLLGGTGQASFDDLQIHPAAENPSVLPGKPLP